MYAAFKPHLPDLFAHEWLPGGRYPVHGPNWGPGWSPPEALQARSHAPTSGVAPVPTPPSIALIYPSGRIVPVQIHRRELEVLKANINESRGIAEIVVLGARRPSITVLSGAWGSSLPVTVFRRPF